MGDRDFAIMIVAFVLMTMGIAMLMLVQFMYESSFKPDMVSINSVNKMSCEELESNYVMCRKDMHTSDWGYCNSLFLPKYYERCKLL